MIPHFKHVYRDAAIVLGVVVLAVLFVAAALAAVYHAAVLAFGPWT